MGFFAFLGGLTIYVIQKILLRGLYTVRPDERAVITTFGRVQRLPGGRVSDPSLSDDEQERYRYPAIRVIQPGGPYFKWPWQELHKVNVATQAVDLVWDPTKSQQTIEANELLESEAVVDVLPAGATFIAQLDGKGEARRRTTAGHSEHQLSG
jgi:regulator of protease activity HflC (stomatin/prohibitin superfamily)